MSLGPRSYLPVRATLRQVQIRRYSKKCKILVKSGLKNKNQQVVQDTKWSARKQDAGPLACSFFVNGPPPRPFCAALRPKAAARSLATSGHSSVVFLLSNDKGCLWLFLCAVNLSTTQQESRLPQDPLASLQNSARTRLSTSLSRELGSATPREGVSY